MEKLCLPVQRTHTFDRELLAAHAAIRHFLHFCEDRAFQLWTDHKLLMTALPRISVPHFAAAAVPFGFHFRIQCADVVSAWFENVLADFCPAHPPHRSHLKLLPLRQL